MLMTVGITRWMLHPGRHGPPMRDLGNPTDERKNSLMLCQKLWLWAGRGSCRCLTGICWDLKNKTSTFWGNNHKLGKPLEMGETTTKKTDHKFLYQMVL